MVASRAGAAANAAHLLVLAETGAAMLVPVVLLLARTVAKVAVKAKAVALALLARGLVVQVRQVTRLAAAAALCHRMVLALPLRA